MQATLTDNIGTFISEIGREQDLGLQCFDVKEIAGKIAKGEMEILLACEDLTEPKKGWSLQVFTFEENQLMMLHDGELFGSLPFPVKASVPAVVMKTLNPAEHSPDLREEKEKAQRFFMGNFSQDDRAAVKEGILQAMRMSILQERFLFPALEDFDGGDRNQAVFKTCFSGSSLVFDLQDHPDAVQVLMTLHYDPADPEFMRVMKEYREDHWCIDQFSDDIPADILEIFSWVRWPCLESL